MAAAAAARGTPLPPLTPDGTRTFPYRPTITDEMRTALTDYGGHARRRRRRWKALHAAAGYNEDDQVDEEFEYHPGDEIDDRDNLFIMRFLYAFWRLCGQDIAQLDDVPPGHAARLQAERAGVTPDVRVATIRSITRPHRSAGYHIRLATPLDRAHAQSASGTPPSSATRSSTAGPTSKAPPTNRCSVARWCAP